VPGSREIIKQYLTSRLCAFVRTEGEKLKPSRRSGVKGKDRGSAGGRKEVHSCRIALKPWVRKSEGYGLIPGGRTASIRLENKPPEVVFR
jgi:hypothetical protein